MFKKLFSKKCTWCRKPHAINCIPLSKQSFDLFERNSGRGAFLCDECYANEVKRKDEEVLEKKKKEILNNKKEYVFELRSIVEAAELELKAIELGLDIKALKSKWGIPETRHKEQ